MAIADYVNRPAPATIQPTDLGPLYTDRYFNFSPMDSRLWLQLFVMAEQHSRRLYEILEWMRAVGTVLVRDQQYGYRIMPVIGDRGWRSMQEYITERQALNEFGPTLLDMLKRLVPFGDAINDKGLFSQEINNYPF